jgi:small-conductance mechanosensitive channel
VLGGMDRIFRDDARFPALEARANRYYPAIRALVSTLIALVAIVALLEVWGVDAAGWFTAGRIGGSLASAFASIAVAVLIALVIWESCDAAVERHLARLNASGDHLRAVRLRTLLPILRTALMLTILVVVGLTALSQIGVNIAPLLAGAASSCCSRTPCRSATSSPSPASRVRWRSFRSAPSGCAPATARCISSRSVR